MPRRRLIAASLVIGALTSIQLNGCTIIGLGIGSVIDSGGETHYRSASPTRLYTIPEGTRLTLVLSDSTRVTGRLGRARKVASEGRGIAIEHLRSGRESGDLGASWQVGIRTTDGAQWVDYDRIARLELRTQKHGKTIGLAVGITVDGLLLGAALGRGDREPFVGGCSS